jgi:lysophospholipase L1-like esterase
MRPVSLVTLHLLLAVTTSSACGSSPPAAARADAGAGAAPAPVVPSNRPAAVRLEGRYDTRDPKGPKVGWPGAHISARFRGTEAFVTLAEELGEAGPSLFDVIVDGGVQPTVLTPAAGEAEYMVASGLPAGPHVVELRRRTEGRVGTTQFRGFRFPGGELLPAEPAPSRRIEFLGDSEMNGYGIEGTFPCTFSGATQNEGKAYPALVAKDLVADHVTVSYSGKGISRNPSADDTTVFGALYGRSLPLDPSSAWNFGAYVPDVVVIALGGNDWERPDPAVFDPPDVAALEAKYLELVASVRGYYPLAKVFVVHPASLTADHPEGYDAYAKMKQVLDDVVAARAAAGDTQVFYFELPRAQAADRTGCDYHYNAAFHRTLADSLIVAIRARTGW